MRAATLARVSTAEQADAAHDSLAAQRRAMRERCEREGWQVVAEYEIPGESAFTADWARRPQFEAVIQAAERREFDALVVFDLSRLARDQYIAHATRLRLSRAGVLLYDATSWREYTSRRAGLEYGLLSALNETANVMHGERVAGALAARHERGLPTGVPPFGYRREVGPNARGHMAPMAHVAPVVVPEEAAVVRELFARRARGEGPTRLAEWLNERGFRPRSRHGFAVFVPSTVQEMLRNPFYAGMVSHRGSVRRGQHEPIVTAEEFAAAQPGISPRKPLGRGREARMLTGLATCALCEGPVWTEQRYYRDGARKQFRACAGAGRGWRTDVVEAQVSDIVLALAPSRDASWLRRIDLEARGVGVARRVDGERERRRLEEQRERAGVAFARGAIDAAVFEELVAEVERGLAATSAPPSGGELAFAARRMESLAEVWRGATAAEQREALSALFRRVWLDLAGQRLWVEPWPAIAPLLSSRRDHVLGDIRPGGLGRMSPNISAIWYARSELVAMGVA